MRAFLYLWIMPFLFACQASLNVPAHRLPYKLTNHDEFVLIHDGKRESFSSIYKRPKKATVFIFWQTACACVKRYQSRINRLFHNYQSNEISFFHISSNSYERSGQVLSAYKSRSVPLPLLLDENGKLAKAIGAKGTPTAAIVDNDGQIIFLGWIDNEYYENEKGRLPYLENAILDIKNDRPIKIATSPMFGCPIR